MDILKATVFCNALIKCFGFFCITSAAMFFDNAAILWWYLILLCVGMDIKVKDKEDAK